MSKYYVTKGLLLSWTVAYSGLLSADLLNLSDTPPSVSSSVEPNVMMLIDTSGSMGNVIYEEGFDPSVDTGSDVWQRRVDYVGGSYSYLDLGANTTYYPNNFYRGPCSAGFKSFRKKGSAETKCLAFPSHSKPYPSKYVQYIVNKYPDGTDLSNLQVFPQQSRNQVAIEVATNVISNTSGMRFGLAKFDSSGNNDGAHIDHACGADKSDILTTLSKYGASSYTPLAESLYDITRYFRGMSDWYGSGTYTSPIQYRCQTNFTVVVTDGLPTQDGYFPTSFPADDDAIPAGSGFPDWDGLHPDTKPSQRPNFPAYSDGFGTDGESSVEGATLYLDDIAKFAWDIDLKNTTALDKAGVSFNDPSFKKQNMYTYTVGFTTANSMLRDAAEYGNGLYLQADNAQQLTAALEAALLDIADKSTSATAVAANTGRVQSGSSIFQAKFYTSTWSGDLLSFDIDTDKTSATYGDAKTSGSGPEGAKWSAADKMPTWNARHIFTNFGQAGKKFRWDQFTAQQKESFFDKQQAMLEYLRGRTTSNGNIDVSNYRARTSVLGDIVHSAPQYQGAPKGRYKDSLESSAYSAFVSTHKNRDPMVYVGANDGMLHAFDAETGIEKMAYIPGALLPHLKQLADPNYKHRYFVNATPTIVDAYFSSGWKTVLVGGLGKGAQSVYALDVTDPSNFGESNSNASKLFMWEFTDADDADLGYVYGRPKIVKMHDGRWYAVFGNGYNNTKDDGNFSTTGNAVIYIVDLESKNVVKLDTGVGAGADPLGKQRPNGIATATPVDVDGDYQADFIYAGDLFGNVWKFDVTGNQPSSWKVAYKLFSACSSSACTGTAAQPITSGISTGFTGNGTGLMVFFGTGKYLEIDDNNGAQGGLQSLYGILDTGAAATVSRSDLLQQTVTSEKFVTATDTKGTTDTADDTTEQRLVRETSNHTITNEKGWYLDLKFGGERGERVVNAPEVRGDRVFFITKTPGNDPCLPSGVSWIYQLGSKDGKKLQSTWDIYEDGKFDSNDGHYTGVQVGDAAGFNTMVDDFGEQIYLGLERLGAGANSLLQNRQSWQEITQ